MNNDRSVWKRARRIMSAILVAALGACTSDVTRTDAHRLVSHGALLVEVRGPGEFAERHPDEAINIPLDKLRDRLGDGPSTAAMSTRCLRRRSQTDLLSDARIRARSWWR